MKPLEVRIGDDLPTLYLQLKDIESDTAVDLSPPTTVVTGKFRKKGSSTLLATNVAAKLFGGATGWVSLAWGATDLDVTSVGMYEIEISVSFDGSIQTAVKHWWSGTPRHTGIVIPVRVRDDF